MGSRNSLQDADGITWHTTNIRLGSVGLDLRNASDPVQLAELLNARFLDERTLQRRGGHTATAVQDGSAFPPVGDSITPNGWLYGHGQLTSEVGPGNRQDYHHPIAGRAGLTFEFGGANVVWTGDRLLAVQPSGPANGSSHFWQRRYINDTGGGADSGAWLLQGVPAYLPLQTDSNPPNTCYGGYVNTVLTPTLRLTVDVTGEVLTAWLQDRTTGAAIDHSAIDGGSDAPSMPVAINSGGIPVVVWRDTGDSGIYWSHWTGTQWANANQITATADTFDVIHVPGGFHLIYRVGGVIKAIKYSGVSVQTSPYPVNTVLPTTATPNGAIAANIDPTGNIGVTFEASTGLYARVYKPDGTAWTFGTEKRMSTFTGWSTGGLTICSRGLVSSGGTYEWILHGYLDGTNTSFMYYKPLSGGAIIDAANTKRTQLQLASKSFRIGHEVFCWLYCLNSKTNVLMAGYLEPLVAGFADREEGVATTDGFIQTVTLDPLDDTKATWARRINTGQAFPRGGDVRIGDLDMLPHPTAARFGRSLYISGSCVKNWDGVTLADAGFADYPKIENNLSQTTGGGLTLLGTYNYRAYAVRYNQFGERFESAAITQGFTLTGSNNKLNISILPVCGTSHDDVVIELYRTEANGTTFFLEGTFDNVRDGTMTFVSTMADATLRTKVEDSHATGVGNPAELESFAPIGCALLVAAGDRLWGAGGQVPAGTVQFSKLWSSGFGAGFDDLSGYQVVDIEGDEVTSLAPFDDAIVFFQRNRLFVIGGQGPDNFGSGSFSAPQIRLADGAITHRGTALTPVGLFYWGADGPRVLQSNFTCNNVCAPVRPQSKDMVPTGCRVDFARQEIIWYSATGDALLFNFRVSPGRWARWSGVPAADVSQTAHVTADGVLMVYADDAVGDGGYSFPFTVSTGHLRPDDLLQDHSVVRRVGVTGEKLGAHDLRFRMFYNGSPLWSEEFTWSPDDETWLTPVDDVSALTAAQVDQLTSRDHSGAYGTHHRVKRQQCQFFRVEISDGGSDHQTFLPYELVFELGAEGGLGRIPINTFSRPL